MKIIVLLPPRVPNNSFCIDYPQLNQRDLIMIRSVHDISQKLQSLGFGHKYIEYAGGPDPDTLRRFEWFKDRYKIEKYGTYTLQFKLGTGPLSRHIVDFVPNIGDRIMLPYPAGGTYSVTIDDIYRADTLEQCIFYGTWL